MAIRFIFDVEARNLHDIGFAFGYVVVDVKSDGSAPVILEEGECYSIEGAQQVDQWVKDNVIPSLDLLKDYMTQDISTIDASQLPTQLVLTDREMRDRFFTIYSKWNNLKAEIWSDVNFPVETDFLSAVVRDDLDNRRFKMPYPLRDISTIIGTDLDRAEYCQLKNLRNHNPLDDSKASAFSLIRFEEKMRQKQTNKQLLSDLLQQSGHPVFQTVSQDEVSPAASSNSTVPFKL